MTPCELKAMFRSSYVHHHMMALRFVLKKIWGVGQSLRPRLVRLSHIGSDPLCA